MDRAHQHQQRAAIAPPTERLPDEEQEAEVNALLAEADRLKEETAALVPQVETAKDSTAGLEQQRASVQAEHDGLEAYAGVDVSGEEEVRDLVGRRAELSERSRPWAPSQPKPSPAKSAALLWTASAIVALASIAGAVFVGVVALVGLVIAGAVAYLAYQRARITVPRRGVDPAAIARRKDEIDTQLSAALDRVGATAMSDLSQRAQSYLTGCARHGRRLELAARLGELQSELMAARGPLRASAVEPVSARFTDT